MEAPPLSPDPLRATAALRASLRRFERTSEQIALARGLTPRQYLLLLMIKGSPGGDERATVSELSERLQLAQHTVTELVARAEAARLIRRERSARDARVSCLRLTADGERRQQRSATTRPSAARCSQRWTSADSTPTGRS